MKSIDLEKLEDTKVSFGKHAFSPKEMYCESCNNKMKKIKRNMRVSKYISVTLDIFSCPKCHEEMLGLDEAKKLDQALIINRILSDKVFKLKRKLSYDGDNYILRLPGELTQGKPTEVTIIPLKANEALIRW